MGEVSYSDGASGRNRHLHSRKRMRAPLQILIRDHFAILIVGRSLTSAFRKAVFALADEETTRAAIDYDAHLIRRRL